MGELVLSAEAKRINELHEACEGAARTTLEAACEIGERLVRIKASMAHGRFGEWFDAECVFTSRMGRTYMTAYARSLTLPSTEQAAEQNQPASIRALTAPIVPPKPQLCPESQNGSASVLSENGRDTDEAPRSPQLPKDCVCNQLRKPVAEALRERDDWMILLRELATAVRHVEMFKDKKTAAFIHIQEVTKAISDARRMLKFGMPHGPCGYCDQSGKESAGRGTCKACKGLGWLPRDRWDQMPADLKALDA